MSRDDKRPKQGRPPIRVLLRPIVKGRRGRIVRLSATALLSALAEAGVLVAITQIAFALAKNVDRVDLSLGPVDVRWKVGTSVLIAFLLVALRGATQVGNGWLATRLVSRYTEEARKEFAHAYIRASLAEQSRSRGGELQELLTGYVGRGASVMDTLSKGVTAGCSLLALLATALAVSPLAAGGLIGAVTVLGMTILPLRRVIGGSSRSAANADMAFATAVNEYATLGREMQVFGVEDEVERELDGLIEHNASAAQRLQFLAFLFTPLYATVLLGLLVGGLAAVRALGITDLAVLGAVMLVMIRSLAYAQLAQGVFAALHSYAPYLSDVQKRLEELQADEVDRGGAPVDRIMPMRASSLSFQYEADRQALVGLDFELRFGEIIGIVGPSGSGKSTLVQLLLRLRRPTEGSLTADGTDVGQYSIASWRERTAFVPQDSHLVRGTVAENIRFFRDGYSDDEVRQAAAWAQVEADIDSWPDGFEHRIGDEGRTLSGGQQQRICIARALLSRPDLLIMDEPTSALDLQSEARIRDAIEEMRGETTVVIVAHRLSTLEICDRLMVIKDGRLRSFDTPKRLRETDSFYKEALSLSGLE